MLFYPAERFTAFINYYVNFMDRQQIKMLNRSFHHMLTLLPDAFNRFSVTAPESKRKSKKWCFQNDVVWQF